jgi:hypothetical protein
MKRLVIVILFGLSLTACHDSNFNNEQDAKIQELEYKIKQLSDIKAKESQQFIEDSIANELIESENKIKQLSDIKAKESQQFIKDSIANELIESENKIFNDLKLKHKYVRAKFISTSDGDFFYYSFIDENGKYYTFNLLKDKSYDLLIVLDSSSVTSINPKYKNKTFDIFYDIEAHELFMDDARDEINGIGIVVKIVLVD